MFVSTLSAFANRKAIGIKEDGPLHTPADPEVTQANATYGPLKVRCEMGADGVRGSGAGGASRPDRRAGRSSRIGFPTGRSASNAGARCSRRGRRTTTSPSSTRAISPSSWCGSASSAPTAPTTASASAGAGADRGRDAVRHPGGHHQRRELHLGGHRLPPGAQAAAVRRPAGVDAEPRRQRRLGAQWTRSKAIARRADVPAAGGHGARDAGLLPRADAGASGDAARRTRAREGAGSARRRWKGSLRRSPAAR